MMKYAGDLISALIRHVRLHSKNAVSNFGNTRQPQRKLKNNVQKCASPSSSEKSCMFPVRRQPLVAIGIIMAAKEEVRQSSSQLREAVGSKMHMTFPQEAAILVQRTTKSHCQWFFTERDVSICRIRSFLVKDATQLLGQARQNHRGAPCFQSNPNSPMWPPHPPLASCRSPHPIRRDGTCLQRRQQNCTHLPPDTGQTPAIAESKQRSSQRSQDSSLLCRLSGGMNYRPVSWQQSHSPSSAKDSRLTRSDFTSTLHSKTPSHPREIVTCH